MTPAPQSPAAKPVLVCFGTRPEVVKLARVVNALKRAGMTVVCATTGQHREMLDRTLDAFDLIPEVDLALMSANQSLGELSGRAIPALGAVIESVDPSAVLVQGDTTTAFCAALAAFYAQVPVAHVEAGLRTHSLETPFPEEGNRRLIGQLARWHFCPTELARLNLRAEGIPHGSAWVTGNTGIDAARWTARRLRLVRAPRAGARREVLVTMHRRESQGEPQRAISRMLAHLADRGDVHLTFPVHLSPAVRASVLPELADHANVTLCDPLGYDEFIRALATADLALTDSGGVQEEAPTFGVPVVVMRDTTERPEGVDAGCAVLGGTDPDRILQAATRVLDDDDLHARMSAAPNPYGDGHAASRIAARLSDDLGGQARDTGPDEHLGEATPAQEFSAAGATTSTARSRAD
jgi:UDP-N-acetylglucosamine 2-epimerase (non-hydrolysing)